MKSNEIQHNVQSIIDNFSKEEFMHIYHDMKMIREFETMLNLIKTRGEYEGIEYNHPGPAHLSIGQESAAVGMAYNLTVEDFVFGSHRSHGEILAKGMSAINKLSEDYITYLSNFNHLFENTFEILDYLKESYNLHIITNGFSEIQHKKLTKSSINHYFETVTNSESVGVKKPNPKIFKHALKVANVKVDQSVMIGDNYEADILGALNIGMDAVYFGNYNKILNDKVKQVDNLIHLKKYL